MANKLGKRYNCTKCGATVLCVKEGSGEIQCCDTKMEEPELRALPSSD